MTVRPRRGFAPADTTQSYEVSDRSNEHHVSGDRVVRGVRRRRRSPGRSRCTCRRCRSARSRRSSSFSSVAVIRAPVAPSGWPSEMPPPFGLMSSHPILEARVVRELEHDRRERLVHLDHRDVVPRQPGARERLRARLRVAVQHPVRVDAGEAERDEARTRLEPEPRSGGLRRDEHRCGAVADLRRVAGGDHPVRA